MSLQAFKQRHSLFLKEGRCHIRQGLANVFSVKYYSQSFKFCEPNIISVSYSYFSGFFGHFLNNIFFNVKPVLSSWTIQKQTKFGSQVGFGLHTVVCEVGQIGHC